MLFILRTWKKQAEIEGKEPFTERDDDYLVVIDGPHVGRIYLNHDRTWKWSLQSPTGAIGYADSLEQAKEDLKKRWFEETKKLSKH
jgi:hypothetical protein